MVTARPRLVDLFCSAGGASMGYHLGGFDVVGVDLEPQPNYPFRFVQADALDFDLDGFDAVAASPPCQAYSSATKFYNGTSPDRHPDLLPATRDKLEAAGIPYAIENVPGAPMRSPVVVCGTALRMPLRRHRLFESNVAMLVPPCDHSIKAEVYPHGNPNAFKGYARDWARVMEIDWMTGRELAQAIPPAYTRLIGSYLLEAA